MKRNVNEGKVERYVTKGVQEQVPLDVQLFLWHEYDKCTQMDECDYLHVFKLKGIIEDVDGFNLVVVHEQEVPEYHRAYVLNTVHQIKSLKVYIIDDQTHQTMLLTEEY